MDGTGDYGVKQISQVQKQKGHTFSLICRREIQKINIYTKET
jgi:hypothetical protein